GSDRQRLPHLRAGITFALVRSRSARRARPLNPGGDLVILFLSLGLSGARTGDCPLRPGRLLLDGGLVVFPAAGRPQEAIAQQSDARYHARREPSPAASRSLRHAALPQALPESGLGPSVPLRDPARPRSC